MTPTQDPWTCRRLREGNTLRMEFLFPPAWMSFDTLRIPANTGNPGQYWGSLSVSWPLWSFHSRRLYSTLLTALPAKSWTNWRQVISLLGPSFLDHSSFEWKSFLRAFGIVREWRELIAAGSPDFGPLAVRWAPCVEREIGHNSTNVKPRAKEGEKWPMNWGDGKETW